jgi:hypothetical protein
MLTDEQCDKFLNAVGFGAIPVEQREPYYKLIRLAFREGSNQHITHIRYKPRETDEN